MNQTQVSLNKWILTFVLLVTPSLSSADSLLSNLKYSARVRPLAVAYGIPGFELFATTSEGYFIGPTFHYYGDRNDLTAATIDATEVGIKFGRVFPSDLDHQGWFIMGDLNFLSINQSTLYSPTNQTFRNRLNVMYEAMFVGYQFNSLLFGPNQWDLRFGFGMVNREAASKTFTASNGALVPVGLRERLDPTLEFTVGYVF